MNQEVEFHIRNNHVWAKLPSNIKQLLGNSQREYEKQVFDFSVKNQLRFKGNLVRHVRKEEKKYYDELLQFSRDHLMLYPYHLSEILVRGLRITPFAYYLGIVCDIMSCEKSYDSLPNFTAADCLRLLGIGRNQYIDIMNQCRSSKKFFRRKSAKDLLPAKPVEEINIEPWWISHVGYITEDDIRMCSIAEKNLIDKIIDQGPSVVGSEDNNLIQRLYIKGLLYLEVPIDSEDCIIVPPLEGFVMNRVQGDYFEKLLYKIFVSIDEHTKIVELAKVLEIDLQLVKNAVSLYCRLGFARKKGQEVDPDNLHCSWKNRKSLVKKSPQEESMLIDWTSTVNDPIPVHLDMNEGPEIPETANQDSNEEAETGSLGGGHNKRIGFLFDSTLTAFLMMGNLSPGLKSHAVTMFEVGKLTDESLDSFLAELKKVPMDNVAEGEAQRYFDHAITLRNTILFLRNNKDITPDPEFLTTGLGIDLLRCESLHGLDPATCSRVLQKNYALMVSMAPLSKEIRPICSSDPEHLGPAIPEVNSVWFKLFLYSLIGNGPPSLLIVKGTRLRVLPEVFQNFERLLITTWGHDPGIVSTSNVLLTLNDALMHSAVLIQVHGWQSDGETTSIAFPLETKQGQFSRENLEAHCIVGSLSKVLDLSSSCGVITLLRTGRQLTASRRQSKVIQDIRDASQDLTMGGDGVMGQVRPAVVEGKDQPLRGSLTLPVRSVMEGGGQANSSSQPESEVDWTLLDLCYGLPLFDDQINKEVCQRIAAKGLCNKESLAKLHNSNQIVAEQLLSFIKQYQSEEALGNNGSDNTELKKLSLAQSSVKAADALLPIRNLMFDGEKLKIWKPDY